MPGILKKPQPTTGFGRWPRARFICSQTPQSLVKSPPFPCSTQSASPPPQTPPKPSLTFLLHSCCLHSKKMPSGAEKKWDFGGNSHGRAPASPCGFCLCHNLLLQQQIVNGLAVWSRNELGFPMEKQLCSRSPRSHFSRSLHLAATQGTWGEPQPGGSFQR